MLNPIDASDPTSSLDLRDAILEQSLSAARQQQRKSRCVRNPCIGLHARDFVLFPFDQSDARLQRRFLSNPATKRVLAKQSEHHIVQCKHWRATKVPVTVVRELYGVMAAQGAAGGFVVTAGEFTREARDFASGRNVELINGAVLAAMLREASAPLRSTPPVDVPPSRIGEPDPGSYATPHCRKCSQPMVKRVAGRGRTPEPRSGDAAAFPRVVGSGLWLSHHHPLAELRVTWKVKRNFTKFLAALG